MDNKTTGPPLTLKLILQWMGIKFLLGILAVLFLAMFVLSQGLGAQVKNMPPNRWNEAVSVGYDNNHNRNHISQVGFNYRL